MSSKSGIEPVSPAMTPADPGNHKSASIAARLTFWYALLSIVLIAAAGGMLYWVLTDRLQQEDDRLLAGKIAEARAVLVLHPSDYAALLEEVQHEAETLPGIYIRVLDGHGAIVAESHASSLIFDHLDSLAPSLLSRDERGRDWTSSKGKKYRILSGEFEAGSQFIVHAAMSMSKEEQFLASYRKTLLLAISSALVLAVAAGYWIARREMRPASRLAGMVAQVGAADLNRRVGDNAWPRELRPLATNFDQLLARLEDSFTRISQFSADIAHELRTPLHILQGEAEIALSKARSNEDYRACIESAAEEYQRLAAMVDALLFLARAEQPDAQLDKQFLELDCEIADVCGFYQAMADEQTVTLAAQGAGRVVADASLLRRALGNLIANALRHTPPGGQVAVEAKETPDHTVEIAVSDTGDGIAPEDLAHVFDRFYRADIPRSRTGAGTGLGLAIVKFIMQLHGGTVSIQSELHRGTTITLAFPAVAIQN